MGTEFGGQFKFGSHVRLSEMWQTALSKARQCVPNRFSKHEHIRDGSDGGIARDGDRA